MFPMLRPTSIRVVDVSGDEHVIRFEAVDAVKKMSPRQVLNAERLPVFEIHLRNGLRIDVPRQNEDVLEAFAEWLGKRQEALS